MYLVELETFLLNLHGVRQRDSLFDRKIPEFDKISLKQVGGHIDRNTVKIALKMRIVVQSIQIIIINPNLKKII